MICIQVDHGQGGNVWVGGMSGRGNVQGQMSGGGKCPEGEMSRTRGKQYESEIHRPNYKLSIN